MEEADQFGTEHRANIPMWDGRLWLCIELSVQDFPGQTFR